MIIEGQDESDYPILTDEQIRINNIDSVLIGGLWSTGKDGYGLEFEGLDETQTNGEGFICPGNLPIYKMSYFIKIDKDIPYLNIKTEVKGEKVESVYEIVKVDSAGNGILELKEEFKDSIHLTHPNNG